MYNLNQNVVEKLPSFVKLISPFRKPIYINQHILDVDICCFFDLDHLIHLLMESSLIGWMVVLEMVGM